MKKLNEWFFLRNGFTTFMLEPEVNQQLLFGKEDRRQRDRILDGLEEASYGLEGHKAVVYGDYGRGKTHQCMNLMFEIERRSIPLVPVYVKCTEYKAKEPFTSLFSQLVLGLTTPRIHKVATEYERLVQRGAAKPIIEVIGSEDIAQVFAALSMPNQDIVRLAMRWLGGEGKLEMTPISKSIVPQLTVSRDFALVMRGLAHMFKQVEQKVIVYFIDESERFGQVTQSDTYWSWVASLRALTEIVGVAYIFFVGAKGRDNVPDILIWDEIVTRIGASNYTELFNPGHDELRQWVLELLQTMVQKGEVPPPLAPSLNGVAADNSVVPELATLVGGDDAALAAFPFTASALDEFIDQCVSDNLANKPREVLKRIQRGCTRSMKHDKRFIDEQILEEVKGDGF